MPMGFSAPFKFADFTSAKHIIIIKKFLDEYVSQGIRQGTRNFEVTIQIQSVQPTYNLITASSRLTSSRDADTFNLLPATSGLWENGPVVAHDPRLHQRPESDIGNMDVGGGGGYLVPMQPQ